MPSDRDQYQLAQFGLSKNWKIVYPSFDPADPLRGPLTYHVVVTDGLTETIVLKDGRLWKSDRRSQAVILFAKPGITVKVNSKGRLIVRGMTGRYHDHGYDLALEGVTTRAAREPGHTPVVSTIGDASRGGRHQHDATNVRQRNVSEGRVRHADPSPFVRARTRDSTEVTEV